MNDFKNMTPDAIVAECHRLVSEHGNRHIFVPGRVSVRADRLPLAPIIGHAEIGFFGVNSIHIDDDKQGVLIAALGCAREAAIRIEEVPGAMSFVSITAAEEPTS